MLSDCINLLQSSINNLTSLGTEVTISQYFQLVVKVGIVVGLLMLNIAWFIALLIVPFCIVILSRNIKPFQWATMRSKSYKEFNDFCDKLEAMITEQNNLKETETEKIKLIDQKIDDLLISANFDKKYITKVQGYIKENIKEYKENIFYFPLSKGIYGKYYDDVKPVWPCRSFDMVVGLDTLIQWILRIILLILYFCMITPIFFALFGIGNAVFLTMSLVLMVIVICVNYIREASPD